MGNNAGVRSAFAATLGIVVAGGLLAPTTATAADVDGVVALNGQVNKAVALENARFRVWLKGAAQKTASLGKGDAAPRHALDADTAVDAYGSTFEISIDPNKVPEEYVSENNLVALEIEIFDPASNNFTWTTKSVRMAGSSARAEQAWADPVAAPPGGKAARAAAASPPAVTLELTTAPEAMSSADQARTAGIQSAQKVKYDSKDRWATIGSSYPSPPGYGNTNGEAWMKHETGAEITYGAGYSTGGTSWSSSGSATVTNSTGTSFRWAPETWLGNVYRTQVRYNLYNHYNKDGVFLYKTAEAVSETGGYKTINLQSNPPYWLSSSTCIFNYPAGTWKKTTGSAYTLGTGVKIGDVLGIDLSTQRAYTSKSSLSYKMTANHDSLCGNSDKPAYAPKVQQYYNRIEEEL